eukprot:6101585-Karenia_brevis.AAC.1
MSAQVAMVWREAHRAPGEHMDGGKHRTPILLLDCDNRIVGTSTICQASEHDHKKQAVRNRREQTKQDADRHCGQKQAHKEMQKRFNSTPLYHLEP